MELQLAMKQDSAEAHSYTGMCVVVMTLEKMRKDVPPVVEFSEVWPSLSISWSVGPPKKA